MAKLKVGVIGVGSISSMHINSYINNPNVELIALCDINEERLKEKALKYNIKNTFTDYREMLNMKDLDAVSICTWNNFHAPISIYALKKGKHVLCEKPLCMTVNEALEIQKVASETKKVMQVGFVRRFASNTNTIKEFISHGDLGDIYYSKVSSIRRIGNPGGWFADIERSGGGPLIDIGVHVIDIAWYLMGKPKLKSVSGNVYNKLGNLGNIVDKAIYKAADYSKEKNTVEDAANALIRFENGSSLYVDVSYSLYTEKDITSIELFGDKGGAIIEPTCKVFSQKHDRLIDIVPVIDNPTFDFQRSFQNEIDSFVNSCLFSEKNISPVDDGVTIMKILRAVYESSESGKEITF